MPEEDMVTISREDLSVLLEYARGGLARQWDQYTDTFITRKTTEEGLRYMNPEVYDLIQKLDSMC